MTGHQTLLFGSAIVRVCFLSLNFRPKRSTGVSKVFKISITHSLILGRECAVLNSWKCNLWGFSLHEGYHFSVAGNRFHNEWTFYMYHCSGGEGAIHHLLVGRWLPPHCVFFCFCESWYWATQFSTLAISWVFWNHLFFLPGWWELKDRKDSGKTWFSLVSSPSLLSFSVHLALVGLKGLSKEKMVLAQKTWESDSFWRLKTTNRSSSFSL